MRRAIDSLIAWTALLFLACGPTGPLQQDPHDGLWVDPDLAKADSGDGVKPPELDVDRVLQTLDESPIDQQLEQAAACLEDGPSILLAGFEVDAFSLTGLAAMVRQDPAHPTRALREAIGQAVDPADFILLLDDVCRQRDRSDLPPELVIPSGRARKAGVLVHPGEVFGDGDIRYGVDAVSLAVDMPLDYRTLDAPPDGAPIGPAWAARYLEPQGTAAKLAQLTGKNPDFARRVSRLIDQLGEQGAAVHIESAVRRRERGLLLYASFALSRAKSEAALERLIGELESLNQNLQLNIPIAWRHDGPWQNTKEAARQLADTYGVVYATLNGAMKSNHYDGEAVDLVAVDLPRELTLFGDDDQRRTFDLSASDHPRDLDLSPELVDWIEQHFGFKKLRSDYPHWDDAR